MSRFVMNCIRLTKPIILLGKFVHRVPITNICRKTHNVTFTHADVIRFQDCRGFCTAEEEVKGHYELQDPASEDEVVNVVYIDKEGKRIPVRGKIGDNILYLAHRYDLDLEGACSGQLACSTCHVYINEEYIDKLDEKDVGEDDMLDSAVNVTDYSRLGCQIKLRKDMDGMEITLPSMTRNFYVDGHVPKPH